MGVEQLTTFLGELNRLSPGQYSIIFTKREPLELTTFQIISCDRVKLASPVLKKKSKEVARKLCQQDQRNNSPYNRDDDPTVVVKTQFVSQSPQDNPIAVKLALQHNITI